MKKNILLFSCISFLLSVIILTIKLFKIGMIEGAIFLFFIGFLLWIIYLTMGYSD